MKVTGKGVTIELNGEEAKCLLELVRNIHPSYETPLHSQLKDFAVDLFNELVVRNL